MIDEVSMFCCHLCSPGLRRCHGSQVCSVGSAGQLCCEGSVDTLLLCCYMSWDHQGRCCCCRDTLYRLHLAMSDHHRNQGCSCHSLHLKGKWRVIYFMCLSKNLLINTDSLHRCCLSVWLPLLCKEGKSK